MMCKNKNKTCQQISMCVIFTHHVSLMINVQCMAKLNAVIFLHLWGGKDLPPRRETTPARQFFFILFNVILLCNAIFFILFNVF